MLPNDEPDDFLFGRMDREPEQFDARGCRAVLSWLAAFWLAAFFTIAWALDWSPWDALKGAM